MSCTSCNQPTCTTPSACQEVRLSIGFNEDKSLIVGSMDGLPLIPLPMKEAVRANETSTALKYDQDTRSLVFENERYKSGSGTANYITINEILSGAEIGQLGGVAPLVEGGLASIVRVDDNLQLGFEIPVPIQSGELSEGFIAYVPNPVGGSRYKTIKPTPGGSVDTVLVGHPDGSIEFVTPIESPVVVPAASLTSNGAFSGAPATSSGDWRYQTMGTSPVITNTYKSAIEVTLEFRFSLQTSSTRNGVYCNLVNGGSDYQTEFVEGASHLKQEGYPGGTGRFSCILVPNQKCQFEFGAWEDDTGNMVITIGSVDEDGSGNEIQTVQPPIITLRRQL